MKKFSRVLKQLLVFFLILFMSSHMMGDISIFAEGGTGKDIGNLMKIDPVSVTKIVGSEAKPIIEKGNKVANAPEVKVGDLLEFKYEFHVDETSLQQIAVGDYFYLNLPDGQHIKAIEGVHDITTPDGKLLGRYTIENGKIKVIVAHLGIQDSGKSGWISFHGTVIKDGENVQIGTKGNTRLTIKPSENGNGGGGGGHDSGKSLIGDDKIVFSKDGKQYIGKNIINWHLNVNYDGLRKMVNGEAVTTKSHVVLEDTLPAGVTVDLHSIYITTPLFVPTPDNKMSGFAVNYPRVHPEVIEPRTGETYQQFYERIKNAEKLTVGVYDKNGEHKLLFGFGNLPGNGINYANILGNETEFHNVIDDHVRSGNITSEQANRMKQVYGTQRTTKGAVVGYDVSFDTNVSGPSGNYENIAQLHWDEQNPDNVKTVVAFHRTEAGINENEKKITIQGTKTWEDGENQDGKRPDKIKVILNKTVDGKTTKAGEKEVTKDNWIYEFTDLPKYEGGKEITYSINEEAVVGYEKEIQGYNLVNKYTPETVSVKGTKTWEDKENQDGKRPDKIKVILNKTVDGKITKASEKEVTKDNWIYEFTDLPKYEGGKEITYSIDEEAVEGYEKGIKGYNLTNKYTPETVTVKGTKTWEDGENRDGKRPDKIKVILNKTVDGKTTKAGEKEVTKDNWTYEFTDLPKYEGGKAITYSIDEEAVAGYEKEIKGYNLVNKYTPETVSIKGTKTWEDKENQDGKRPEKIKVILNKTVDRKTTKAGEKEVTKDNWSYEFTDLPKYEGGKEITYSIDEEAVTGYEKEIKGYNLVNKYTPEKVSIKGTKTWEDGENRDGKRPERIKVILNKTVDGKTSKASEKEVTKDNWSYEFTDLPKYKDGKEITYSIDEEAVTGYEKEIKGYNLVNKYTPEKPTEPNKPKDPEKPVEPNKPKEPEKPTEPNKPKEPEKPTEPNKPKEPEKPTEPNKPKEPEKPTEPNKPKEPEKPTEPNKPKEPGQPTKQNNSKELNKSTVETKYEKKEQEISQTKNEELPKTGERDSAMETMVGFISIVVSMLLFMKKEKRQV